MATFIAAARKKEKDRWTVMESDGVDEYRVSGEFSITNPVKMRAFVKQVKVLEKRLMRSVRARAAIPGKTSYNRPVHD